MFSSLRFRLWLTYVLVVGMVLVIAGAAVVVFLLRSPTIDRQEIQRLRLVSNLLLQRSQLFNLVSGEEPRPSLQEAAERADNLTGARIALFSADGKELADSRRSSARALPDWSFFENRRPGAAPIFRDQGRRQWLYVLTPAEGDLILLAAAPRPRTRILTILRDEFLAPFLRAAAIALILSVLLSIWIAHWIAAPLQRLEKATREASLEEFKKIPLEGPHEVQNVASAFNEMGRRVQASQRSQRDFVANVSHDLKTPLTSIQGFAQAILDGTAEDTQHARQAAQVIYDEAGRMHRMVLELLELARFDAGTLVLKKAQLDLGALLRTLVKEISPQAQQAQVTLRLEIDSQGGGLPPLEADADRLVQVFSNLIDNALKYTPPGGQVTVSVRAVDNWLEVQVADTGIGIPADELERIFERFYQTDKARPGGSARGIGLGLAIAREIVQAHGGTIHAYNRTQVSRSDWAFDPASSAEKGSVFVVRLPAARSAVEPTVRKRKESPFHSIRGT